MQLRHFRQSVLAAITRDRAAMVRRWAFYAFRLPLSGTDSDTGHGFQLRLDMPVTRFHMRLC